MFHHQKNCPQLLYLKFQCLNYFHFNLPPFYILMVISNSHWSAVFSQSQGIQYYWSNVVECEMYSYFHWSAQHQFNPLTHPQLFNPRREWINDKIWQNILFSKYLFFSSRIKDGFKKNQQRVERHRQWSTSSVQRGSSRRWSVPLASNHPGTSRLSIRR